MNQTLLYKISNVIAAIFIFLFAYTSVSKLLNMQPFQFTIKSSPFIGQWPSLIAWSVVFAEWIVVLLLLYPPLRWIGFYLSLLLMSAFTIYIAYMLTTVSHLPCSCGGILKQLSWKAHLVLNVFLTLLSLAGVIVEKKRRKLLYS